MMVWSFAWSSPTLSKAAETFKKLLEETQAISCATLFAPVTRFEAVQAMSTIYIFLSSWELNSSRIYTLSLPQQFLSLDGQSTIG
jgi:hypothetical protein